MTNTLRLRSKPVRICVLATIVLLCFSTDGMLTVRGQQPLEQPPEVSDRHSNGSLTLPATVVPPPPRLGENPRIESQIQSALRDGEISEGSDPILQGMLQVLKQRGSILEGSSLDQPLESGVTPSKPSKQARAAELLLKASRVLESLEPADPARDRLIRQMRSESARLITAEVAGTKSHN